jgi:hypothetical protein
MTEVELSVLKREEKEIEEEIKKLEDELKGQIEMRPVREIEDIMPQITKPKTPEEIDIIREKLRIKKLELKYKRQHINVIEKGKKPEEE